MSEALLGIDIGSSSVKVCVYNRQGLLLGRSTRALQMSHPRPLWAEMDADTIWAEAALAVREAVTGINAAVVSVGVSSACPTTIFLDQNMRPLRPAIIYLDHRSMDAVQTFSDTFGIAEHFALAGNRPGCSTSWLANLVWLRDNEPDVWKRVKCVTLAGGYLSLRMTGRPVIDWTQASYSGGFLVSQPENGWDAELLSRWELDRSILAEVGWSCLPAGTVCEEAAAAMGIAPGATVAFGSADTAASAFALGMRAFGDVFESAGTSGVITFCLDKPVFDNAFMNRCHIFPHRWLAHGAMSTLGGAFNWLRHRVWPELETMEELTRLAAESSPGANGLVFLPYLAGERSPVWDPEASGMWFGLRMDNTRADMVRAVFEGTSFGLKQVFDRGKSFWQCNPATLLGVGGGARSKLWAEIKSDILDVEYLCADEPDAAAWGAALMGGVAAGVYNAPDDPDIMFIAAQSIKTAFPAHPAQLSAEFRMDRAERRENYAKAFAVYEMLYPALKDAMHTLARNSKCEC